MKKILTLILALVLIISLSGCADYAENTAVCTPETIEVEVPVEVCTTPEVPVVAEPEATVEGIFYMQHVSGELTEVTRPVNVLFEYKTLKYTKYQIAYLSCT